MNVGGSAEGATQGGLILCFLRNRDASVSCVLKGVLVFCAWFDHAPWDESMLLYFLRSLPVLLLRRDWLFNHKVPARCGDKVWLRLRSRTAESFVSPDEKICLISSSEVCVLDICGEARDGMLRWLYTRPLVCTLAVRLRPVGVVARGEQGAEPPVRGMLGTWRESEWCRNKLSVDPGLAESTESLFIASYRAKWVLLNISHVTLLTLIHTCTDGTRYLSLEHPERLLCRHVMRREGLQMGSGASRRLWNLQQGFPFAQFRLHRQRRA